MLNMTKTKDEDDLEVPVFSVEEISLHYTHKKWNFKSDPRLQTLSHLYVHEQTANL